MMRTLSRAALGGLLAVVTAGVAQAAETKIDTGDTAWMITATALVLMMTIPGVALFYGGMVRKINVLATIMQSFAICALVTVLWMLIGYSIAFVKAGTFIGGLDRVLMMGMTLEGTHDLAATVPETVFSTFQLTFAIITCALITGAVADRMKFSALMVFTAAWMILVYCPVAYWVWGGGFLYDWGVLDFAGGTVVHINAGVAGLVACLVIGKRKGYGKEIFAPHNLVLSVIGASLLWVGWFGFNAGSAVAAGGRAGMAMLVTQVAAAAAALAWMIAEWMVKGKPSVLGIISGAVGGLVAITPAAGFVTPGSALLIGIISGFICYWGATSLKNMLGYDDSLDAFGVHGVGGFVGAILTGVFAVGAFSATEASPGGSPGLIEGNPGQVVTQFLGAIVVVAYTAVVTFIVLKVIDMLMGLRVDPETEREGLDLRLHGESVH
ncbi:MAG: ammonium transporter [Alphaproteobacteria bacterium]|nr:ammonium transporter [Alphaproteobacteria bacterium]